MNPSRHPAIRRLGGRFLAAVLVLAAMASAPRARAYTYAASLSTDTSKWTAAWNDFKARYVTSSGAGNNLRVLFDDLSSTVSEGQGYGMIMAVYANDRTTLDKLWAYSKSKRNARGLMAWKINADGSIAETTCATDADVDMAYALICADVKWGGYRTDAISVLNAMMTHCVEGGTFVLKPGDVWGGSDATNPSYFATAFFKIFSDYSGDTRWLSVRNKCYQIIAAVNTKNNNKGLQPGWCDVNGNPASGSGLSYNYQYDACRVPWRLAKDWAWFGDTRAKGTLDKINAFWKQVGPYNIVDGYTITGSPTNGWTGSPPFIASAACGVTASSDGTLRSQMWDRIQNTVHKVYYHDALRTLGLLYATGAMNPPAIGGGGGGSGGPIANGTYRVIARHSGKSLDVSSSGTTDGTNVQQWGWNGTNAQRWTFELQADGYYKIRANVGTGKVLDVNASGTANGTNVHIWSDNGTNAQRWRVESLGGGYYRITPRVNLSSCLDVAGGSGATQDGANVQIWSYGGGTNQQWQILTP